VINREGNCNADPAETGAAATFRRRLKVHSSAITGLFNKALSRLDGIMDEQDLQKPEYFFDFARGLTLSGYVVYELV
jgi:hypothetical protein